MTRNFSKKLTRPPITPLLHSCKTFNFSNLQPNIEKCEKNIIYNNMSSNHMEPNIQYFNLKAHKKKQKFNASFLNYKMDTLT